VAEEKRFGEERKVTYLLTIMLVPVDNLSLP